MSNEEIMNRINHFPFIYCVIIFLFIGYTSKAQESTWATSVTSSDYEYGVDSDLDSKGNLFIIGYGTGPNLIMNTTSYSATGGGDAFIAKLDSNRQLLWFKPLGGNDFTYNDEGLDIHVDDNNDVILLVKAAGNFFTYNGDTLSDINSPGQYSGEGVIIKIDNDGNYQWHDDGGVSSSFQNVATDSIGNVYLTGSFSSSLTLVDTFQMLNTASSSSNMFIAKYSPAGALFWAKHVGGMANNNSAFGNNIAFDKPSGKIVVVGGYSGAITFPTGVLSSNSSYATFLVCYDTSGTELWKKSVFGNNLSYCQGLDISSNGTIGIGGFSSLGSSPDGLIGFYDLNGNVQTEIIYPSDHFRILSLDFNYLNECYVSGIFRDTINMGQPINPITLVANSITSGFVAKLSPGKIPVWAVQIPASHTNKITCKNKRVLYSGRVNQPFDYDYGTKTIVNNSGDALFTDILDTTCSFDYVIDTQSACNSYTWINGITYTSSNFTAKDTLTNAMGCDSINVLNLTVNFSKVFTQVVSACDSFLWIDGNTYTISNYTANHLLQTAASCDSLVRLNLSMNYSATGVDSIIACDSIQWIDGNTYSSSNTTAKDTLINAAGCDSVVTLNLTINHSNSGIDTINACDSIQWIDGNVYSSSNDTATFTLMNAVGCDSVVTLNLTINSNSGTDSINTCDSFQWMDGVTYTSSNDTATYTLTNAAGCDSVVTLNLTIINSSTGIDVVTACDVFQWMDGIVYTSSNFTATDTLINDLGCDSIVTLNLTLNYSNFGVDVIAACDSFQWIDGNTYTSSTDSVYYILSTDAGCDSLVFLSLTMNSVSDISTSVNGITVTANNANATSYQWLDCNDSYSIIANETLVSLTATQNGSYAVEIEENGCVDTSDCVLVTSIGIDEYGHDLKIIVYPNPTSDFVNIIFDEMIPTVELTVADAQGKIVNQALFHSESETQTKLGETKGVYYLTIKTDTWQKTISLIKN